MESSATGSGESTDWTGVGHCSGEDDLLRDHLSKASSNSGSLLKWPKLSQWFPPPAKKKVPGEVYVWSSLWASVPVNVHVGWVSIWRTFKRPRARKRYGCFSPYGVYHMDHMVSSSYSSFARQTCMWGWWSCVALSCLILNSLLKRLKMEIKIISGEFKNWVWRVRHTLPFRVSFLNLWDDPLSYSLCFHIGRKKSGPEGTGWCSWPAFRVSMIEYPWLWSYAPHSIVSLNS